MSSTLPLTHQRKIGMRLRGAGPLVRFLIDTVTPRDDEGATIIHIESEEGENLFALHFSMGARGSWGCTMVRHGCMGHCVVSGYEFGHDEFDSMAVDISSSIHTYTDSLLIVRGIFI